MLPTQGGQNRGDRKRGRWLFALLVMTGSLVIKGTQQPSQDRAVRLGEPEETTTTTSAPPPPPPREVTDRWPPGTTWIRTEGGWLPRLPEMAVVPDTPPPQALRGGMQQHPRHNHTSRPTRSRSGGTTQQRRTNGNSHRPSKQPARSFGGIPATQHRTANQRPRPDPLPLLTRRGLVSTFPEPGSTNSPKLQAGPKAGFRKNPPDSREKTFRTHHQHRYAALTLTAPHRGGQRVAHAYTLHSEARENRGHSGCSQATTASSG